MATAEYRGRKIQPNCQPTVTKGFTHIAGSRQNLEFHIHRLSCSIHVDEKDTVKGPGLESWLCPYQLCDFREVT